MLTVTSEKPGNYNPIKISSAVHFPVSFAIQKCILNQVTYTELVYKTMKSDLWLIMWTSKWKLDTIDWVLYRKTNNISIEEEMQPVTILNGFLNFWVLRLIFNDLSSRKFTGWVHDITHKDCHKCTEICTQILLFWYSYIMMSGIFAPMICHDLS